MNSSRPALSLLHGWGMNRAVFDPLQALLGQDFRLYPVELPGHGKAPYSGQNFDAQVGALAEAVPASTLVGWSMGGLYAIELARRYPGRFERLVLIACNPCFVQREDWPCAVSREVFDEFSSALVDDWQATIRRFIGLQLKGAREARQLIRQVTAMLLERGAPDSRALTDGLELLLEHDARTDLARLGQPVMMILGERDSLVPASLAGQMQHLAPSIRVECVARSAHMPFITHPELLAELLRGFVAPTKTG